MTPEQPKGYLNGKTIHAAGADYDPVSAVRLRNDIIRLRDHALNQGQMEWAVKLSHTVSLMFGMGEVLWGEDWLSAVSPGDEK